MTTRPTLSDERPLVVDESVSAVFSLEHAPHERDVMIKYMVACAELHGSNFRMVHYVVLKDALLAFVPELDEELNTVAIVNLMDELYQLIRPPTGEGDDYTVHSFPRTTRKKVPGKKRVLAFIDLDASNQKRRAFADQLIDAFVRYGCLEYPNLDCEALRTAARPYRSRIVRRLIQAKVGGAIVFTVRAPEETNEEDKVVPITVARRRGRR